MGYPESEAEAIKQRYTTLNEEYRLKGKTMCVTYEQWEKIRGIVKIEYGVTLREYWELFAPDGDDWEHDINDHDGVLLTESSLVLGQWPLETIPESIIPFLKNVRELGIWTVKDVYLRELPENIGELSQLEYFELLNLKIRNLPRSFANLVKLQYLSFHECQIEEKRQLIKIIGQLKRLRVLHLPRGLDLGKIPTEIYSLLYLQNLSLEENNITEITRDLLQLKNLQYLDLSSNPINFLPKFLDELLNLKAIKLKEVKERNDFEISKDFKTLDPLIAFANEGERKRYSKDYLIIVENVNLEEFWRYNGSIDRDH